MSLDDVIATAVMAKLREQLPELLEGLVQTEPQPALVDRAGLARALSLSPGSIDKLRREGLPEVRVLADCPRFIVADCVAWLRERSL